MGSHALTRMPPVGELPQGRRPTVTDLAGRIGLGLSSVGTICTSDPLSLL
jgi:hypothetical protein